jgi:MFS superfamily sulfate permease-like transporter
VATMLISLVSCIILYLFKTFVNERYKKKLPAPIPIELMVVILGTALSYAFDFKESKVAVIGVLEKGFPPFKLPSFEIFGRLMGDSFSIAIVSFAVLVFYTF